LQLRGARYAVRSDPLGRHLGLERLEGTGTLRIALQVKGLAERVEELTATLAGRDGSVVTLRGAGASSAVPIGEYRFSALTIRVKDADDGLPWNYVFSNSGDREPPWHKVEKDGTATLDPVGKLELVTGPGGERAVAAPGETLRVQPQLYTGGGLLINTVYRGRTESTVRYGGDCFASVTLVSADGQVLDRHNCGFA
jgi:hypothetical protein